MSVCCPGGLHPSFSSCSYPGGGQKRHPGGAPVRLSLKCPGGVKRNVAMFSKSLLAFALVACQMVMMNVGAAPLGSEVAVRSTGLLLRQVDSIDGTTDSPDGSTNSTDGTMDDTTETTDETTDTTDGAAKDDVNADDETNGEDGTKDTTGATGESDGDTDNDSEDGTETTGDDEDDTKEGKDDEEGDDEGEDGDDEEEGGDDGQEGDEGNTGDEGDTESQGPYAMAYYPDWVGIEPESVDFSLFDWIDFAFSLPTESFELNWDDDSAAVLLKKIVAAAHKGKTKVKLSIGGWTGSKHFSAAMAESDSRSTFVKNIVSLYKKMGVDGVDIDWEYPGQEGAGNKFSPDDTTNYLLFLRALRKALPPKAKITAAVTPEPWVDKTGSPAKDLKDFAEVLDWVLIMNYDVNVPPQKFPGPNAPLRDACGNAKRPMASAEGGLKAWKEAGFPSNKVALGIAAYGYIHKSDAEKLEMRRRLPRQAADDGTEDDQDNTTDGATDGTTGDDTTTDDSAEDDSSDDDTAGGDDDSDDTDSAGDNADDEDTDGDSENTDGENTDGDTDDSDSTGGGDGTLSPDEGGTSQIQFNALVKQGALSSSFKGAGGFTRHWDKCSLTPFLTSDGTLVSYDDPESIKMKGAYAKKHGMLGLGMWDIHGDTKDWALMKAAREGLGILDSSGDGDTSESDDDDTDDGTDEDDTTGKDGQDDTTGKDDTKGQDDTTDQDNTTDDGITDDEDGTTEDDSASEDDSTTGDNDGTIPDDANAGDDGKGEDDSTTTDTGADSAAASQVV